MEVKKKTIKEDTENKMEVNKKDERLFFENFKNKLHKNVFGHYEVYNWIYDMTGIMPHDEDIQLFIDKWIKNKWIDTQTNQFGETLYLISRPERLAQKAPIVKNIPIAESKKGRIMKEYRSASKKFDDNAIILSNVSDSEIDDEDVVVYHFSVDANHDFYVIEHDCRVSDYDEKELSEYIIRTVADYVWDNIDEFNVLTDDDFTEEDWDEYQYYGKGDIADYVILSTSDMNDIFCDEYHCPWYVDEKDITDDEVIEQVKRKYKRMNGLTESRQFRRNRKLRESKSVKEKNGVYYFQK